MGAAENIAVHTSWTEAEDHHDLSHHHEFIHDDIEVHVPGSEPIVGLDGYLAMMEANYAGLTDFRVVLDDQFATDDRVVCRVDDERHTERGAIRPACDREEHRVRGCQPMGVRPWQGPNRMDLP